jgi:hypothetical protein
MDNGKAYKDVWKTKIHEKVRFFYVVGYAKVNPHKKNMIKRNWGGDLCYYFCGEPETVDHLLFSCPVANVVWGIIALCFGQHNRPTSVEQYDSWIKKVLPGGEKFYRQFGMLAIELVLKRNLKKT